ncbi:L-proline dehydrogenase [Halpernia humi]|uniref:L-proline dehydrogenase n=1 Tax=Halpernia humi TaxID=493375 RepID=A0A1H6AZH6_9FLAO|nr:proline dehydrogenase family protein [Halpernia humi]SEG53740.1 L-proline dehydrogenase [Halpernia humi]
MSVFNNTKIAFADKSDAELRKAFWMFKLIEQPTLTKIGTSVLNFAVSNSIPFAGDLVKYTLFSQFCGGVTREESLKVVNKMFKYGVGSIFDYSIEGMEEEAAFDKTLEEIKENIKFAEGKAAIPFVVFKPTGFGRLDLYAEVGRGKELTSSEKEEWQRVVMRFDEVCKMAFEKNVKIMVDAEETWMQDAADDLIFEMMKKYNQQKAVVWNTVQMYRTKRLEFLQKDLENAEKHNFYLGYKFVRGAYMEKERNRAAEMNYEDPIQPTKQATDDNFDAGIDFTLNNLGRISAFFGTHNEKSTELVMDKMKEKGLQNNDPHIYFGQLYGMSDNISFVLGEMGYNVAKYLPYGPVKDVVPYLTRRAQENTSVAGQTGRELALISKELKRRKNLN